jgi:DNA-binding HxlR family transcriptional regulator
LFKVDEWFRIIMNHITNIDYVRPFLNRISRFCAKKWNFQVLWELRNHKKMRYGQIQESLKGISPSTLSEVLKSLQKQGLIKRTKQGKAPPYKVEYSVTKSGTELIVASSALVKWAMRNKA